LGQQWYGGLVLTFLLDTFSGKAIALRLARDGYDICVNDVEANAKGAEEVSDVDVVSPPFLAIICDLLNQASCSTATTVSSVDHRHTHLTHLPALLIAQTHTHHLLTHPQTAAEIKSLGRNATTAIADVSIRAQVAQMIRHSVTTLGPLHCMVANAGIAQVKPLLDLTEADMERMFRVNVFGVHNCYALAANQFIAQGKLAPSSSNDRPTPVYKLIAAASIVAFKPFPLLSHYSASKWAVRGLTQAFAMEMAEYGITVNAYAPGIVGTAMWDLIDEKLAERSGAEKGSMIKKYVGDLTALGRVSTAEDVAGLVGFLAGKDSDFVTGQTQVVDGGIVYT